MFAQQKLFRPKIGGGASPWKYGDLIGYMADSGTGVTNPISIVTSYDDGNIGIDGNIVYAGDLIYVAWGVEVSLNQGSPPSDNLGNTYAACNAGTDGGAATGRAYYSIVTNPGKLTSITIPGTSSANNWGAQAAIVAGPFTAIDRNPANTSGDIVSPYTGPVTGTLTAATEVIMAWIVSDLSGAGFSPQAPFQQIGFSFSVSGMYNVMAMQLVSSTASVTPSFTAPGGTLSSTVMGTTSFR